jgi:hypothetical protein
VAQFHASAANNDDAKDAAPVDDSTGNDGIFGALFGNPYTSIPLCGLGVMSATATDFYVLDAETQLLGLWCMFVGVSYQNFGGAIGQYFDDIADAHLAEQNAQEMAMVQAMKSTQAAHQRQTEIHADINAIFEAQQELMATIVDAKSNELKHTVREGLVAKLDATVMEESRMTGAIQAGLVEAATAQVRSEVSSDAVKTAALEQAFASIADPTAPAAGEDPVAAIYSKAFADFDAKVKSLQASEFELTAEVQQEMKEAMDAVRARDGLDFVNVEVPSKYKIENI